MKKNQIKELSIEDKEFLEIVGKQLDLNKWKDFLLKWAETLESYGTPRSFAYSATFDSRNIEFNGKEYPFVYFQSGGYEDRRKLMAQQKDYTPLDPLESYGIRLDFDNCFLCQNIVQGLDAKNHYGKVGNNIIRDLGIHVLVPNRYPSQFGHTLSVPKDHDDVSTRVKMYKDHEEETNVYPPQEGKTRGNILALDYFLAALE